MDFKFVDADAIKTKFVSKGVVKEKTIEDVRASISKTLLKMLDGTRTNKRFFVEVLVRIYGIFRFFMGQFVSLVVR